MAPMGSAGPGSTRQATGNSYTPHWTTRAFDSAKLFSIQFLTVGGSGAIAKTAVAPLERVKILLQVQHMTSGHQYKGAWDALRNIGRREGLMAYYRGNGANVARLFPDVVLKFALHDHIKLVFTPPEVAAPRLRDRLATAATAGLVRTTLVYPLEVARTRITADTSKAGDPKLYSGLLGCLWTTYRAEGFGGLYKGYFLSAAGIVPYLAVSFAAYDEFKERLPDNKEFRASIWFPICKMGIGAASAIVAQSLTFPIDTVRRRMQMSSAPGTNKGYSSFWRCAGTMMKTEGLRSFYRGAGVNAVKMVPGAAVQFITYDFIKTSVTAMEHSTGRPL